MASECGGDSPSSLPGGGACSDTEASDNSNIDNADEKVQVSSNMQQQTVHQQQQQSPAASSSSSSSLVLSIREYFLVTLTSTPFVNNSVNHINTLLRYAKVPEKSLLTNEEFVLSSTAVIVTLLGYYILFGKRHRNKRRRLAEELRLAQRQVIDSYIRSLLLFSLYLIAIIETHHLCMTLRFSNSISNVVELMCSIQIGALP
jgi:hypothetical protein